MTSRKKSRHEPHANEESNSQDNDHESERLIAARDYISREWSPIPIPIKSKKPILLNWQNSDFRAEDLNHHFSGVGNIGLLMGKPSNGLVDIDLDSPEAVQLAAHFLPVTDSVFGRPSKPMSHHLYQVQGEIKPTSFKGVEGKVHVEIRSTGNQTIVPPSIHPSGEAITWHVNGEPAQISEDVLQKAVQQLAAACILLADYPGKGSRHDTSLCVANLLARAELDETQISNFLIAVASAAGDEEAQERANAARNACERLASGAPSYGLPHLASIIGEVAAKRFYDSLAISYDKPTKISQTQLALDAILNETELWHLPEGRSFATFEVDGHKEHWPLKSVRFRNHLRRIIQGTTGKMPSSNMLEQVLDMADGYAQSGPAFEIAMRCAAHKGNIYIDLVNDAWEVVEISAQDWRIISKSPLRFVRSRGMLFLPRPVSGGKLEDLRQHFNVTDDDDFWLLVGSILAAFRGQGPYPITVLNGEQGSAKSTMARMLRHLIDPNRASARSLQQKEDDLYIAASNGYVLSFDNVSYLNPAISDALCRISTGGGFSKRELYTDLDEIIIDLCRPILMNGIPSLVERPDLMDRAITLTLPSIPPEQRRTEQSVWSEFDLARPALLGSICAAASKALSCIDEIKIIDSPRLIDLVIFMTAVERGLGLEEGRFLRIYTDHQRRARIDLAAADPLVSLIEEIIKDQPFKGTATELRAKIKTKLDGENRWPSGVPRLPNRLTGALRRLAPALRELGITVELEGGRDDDNRKIIKITTGARF